MEIREMLEQQMKKPEVYRFQIGQTVRVLNCVVEDGQTPDYWAGAICTVTSRYTTPIGRAVWYKLYFKPQHVIAPFSEDHLDHRYILQCDEPRET